MAWLEAQGNEQMLEVEATDGADNNDRCNDLVLNSPLCCNCNCHLQTMPPRLFQIAGEIPRTGGGWVPLAIYRSRGEDPAGAA